jgi:hypothetical protein
MKLRHIAFALVLPALLLLSACDRHPHDHGHADLTRVVLEIRATDEAIAEWTIQDGWNVNELRPIPATAAGGERLSVDGPRASLTVRLFGEGGEELDIGTVSRDADGTRTCTDYSARYRVEGGNTNVIAWPPIVEGGMVTKSVMLATGERVDIFHCDHIHIYPEASGETQFQIQLWHLDHDDAATDPLTLVVD